MFSRFKRIYLHSDHQKLLKQNIDQITLVLHASWKIFQLYRQLDLSLVVKRSCLLYLLFQSVYDAINSGFDKPIRYS